jgi:hypothetical protein
MSVHDITLVEADVDGEDPGEDVAHHRDGHGDVGIASVLKSSIRHRWRKWVTYDNCSHHWREDHVS